MKALQAARDAAEWSVTINDPQSAQNQCMRAIMYALIAVAEELRAQTPTSVLIGKDIMSRWNAERRYAEFINEERVQNVGRDDE